MKIECGHDSIKESVSASMVVLLHMSIVSIIVPTFIIVVKKTYIIYVQNTQIARNGKTTSPTYMLNMLRHNYIATGRFYRQTIRTLQHTDR